MKVYPIIMSQGKFLHRDMLQYPYEERGIQFGDGVYEVVRIYHGEFYLLDEHIDRLYRSLRAIRIKIYFSREQMKEYLSQLLSKNNMKKDGSLYLQVTRGSAPRDHLFPKNATPNIYAYMKDAPRNIDKINHGVSAITSPDTRWEYCYIKSLNLLPNVLAKQEAYENDAHEAILFLKDGTVTECSTSNVYLVKDEKIYTHPPTNRILHGCVRMAVEKFSQQLNIPFIEESFSVKDIATADELFLTSSSSEVMPITHVDGEQISNGKRGPITKTLQEAYEKDANIINLKERTVI